MKNDIRNSRAYNTFRKESKEVTDFYLTDEQRERLKNMKNVKRSLYQSGWIMRAMFQKLTPARQLMFIIGIVLLLRVNASFGNVNMLSIDFNALFGGGLLVLVILLELKDKLLAHDELEAGRKIQESLMPERMPHVQGWNLWLYTQAANEVCGDLIDFLKLGEGRFSIAMADVAGKGLHAALITAKLQATIRALAGEINSLPELIGKINVIVHRDSPSHIFSSLVYAECSEGNGTVRYVNAGHFPALIIRASKIEECAKGEAALGLVRSMKFTEQSATLHSGDLFVLYSDGLTEAGNEQGEFFGKERLLSVLTAAAGTPEQIGFAVLREIEQFTGTSAPTDDLSIIIAQRR
ncbi:MAG: serine/threonine-protein phosphatase [Bacteroidetes bacterium]|nr:serine/threonine-protein phosphatase [Bacteroidota bacterium]